MNNITIHPQNNSGSQSMPERKFITLFEVIFVSFFIYLSMISAEKTDYLEHNSYRFLIFTFYFLVKYCISHFLNSCTLYRKNFKGSEPYSKKYKDFLKGGIVLFLLLLFLQFVFIISIDVRDLFIINNLFLKGAASILIFKLFFLGPLISINHSLYKLRENIEKLSQSPGIKHYFLLTVGFILLISAKFISVSSNLVLFSLVSFGCLMWAHSILSFYLQLSSIKTKIVQAFSLLKFDKLYIFLSSFLITAYVYSRLNYFTTIEGSSFPLTLTFVFILTILFLLFLMVIISALIGFIYLPDINKRVFDISDSKIKKTYLFFRLVLPFMSSTKNERRKSKIRLFIAINYLFTFGFGLALSIPAIFEPVYYSDKFIKMAVYELDLNEKVHCSFVHQLSPEKLKNYKYSYTDSAKRHFISFDKNLVKGFEAQCKK